MTRERARGAIASAAARAISALLGRLRPETTQRVAHRLARAYLAIGDRRVRWALQNLRIAFPTWSEAERARVALESCENLVCNVVDLLRSSRWSDVEVLERFEFQGLEHLEAALRGGRGVLLLSLHMGCYELGLRALSAITGLRIAPMVKPMRNGPLQALLEGRRDASDADVIVAGTGGALRALKLLRAGRPLLVLNDLYVRYGRRVEVPLFGRRCLTATGPALLAHRAGAPIVPCYVFRDGPDHHGARLLPALELPDAAGGNVEEAITAACNTALEGIIRAHPENWTWGHRRFRYSPDLPQGIYRGAAVPAPA